MSSLTPWAYASSAWPAGLDRGVWRPFPLRGAQQPEPQLELVRGQVGGAGQLRETALAETALLVHLGQPERRVHVPEGEEDVMVGGGA